MFWAQKYRKNCNGISFAIAKMTCLPWDSRFAAHAAFAAWARPFDEQPPSRGCLGTAPRLPLGCPRPLRAAGPWARKKADLPMKEIGRQMIPKKASYGRWPPGAPGPCGAPCLGLSGGRLWSGPSSGRGGRRRQALMRTVAPSRPPKMARKLRLFMGFSWYW